MVESWDLLDLNGLGQGVGTLRYASARKFANICEFVSGICEFNLKKNQ